MPTTISGAVFRVAVALGLACAWGCPGGDEQAPALCGPLASVPTPTPTDAELGATEDDAGVLQNGRPILADDLTNARDLGGTPLGADSVVPYGVLFRGPPPAALSELGCAEIGELGVATIVDLRIDSERSAKPQDACALEQAELVLAPLPVPYNVSPEDYIADLNATDSVADVFRVLGDDAAYPVYFHCTWGRDRSGVLGALILSALGAAREDIMQEYLLSRASVGAYPRSLEAMLDELECQGGIEAYLAAAGVSADQLATLRARASVPSASD